MKDKYDVIIIGAGIGGLVCGCYLAKAGMKVFIAEKHDKPGGYCTSFTRNGYRFDAAIHYLGGCRKGGQIDKILKELSIRDRLELVHYDPTDKIITPYHTIMIRKNVNDTIDGIKAEFPKEKRGIDKFFNFILNKNFYEIYAKASKITFKNLLDIYLSNFELKSILSILLGNIGLPDSKASALTAIVLYRDFILNPGFYPKDGIQSFPNLLADKFRECGGTIMLKSEVIKIVSSGDGVSGIILSSGKQIKSDIIVSNADATSTFQKLLNTANKTIQEKIGNLKTSISAFAVYLGLNTNVEKLLKDKCAIWYFTTYDMDACYGDPRSNIMHENLNYIVCTFPSLHYSTFQKDKSVVELFMGAPFETEKFWDINKEKVAEKAITKASEVLLDLSKYIDTKMIATPQTFYRYTYNRNGAMYGWASTPDQIDKTIFPQKTDIEGLYLTGHWCTNGLGQGGVSGVAYSGRHIAKIIANRVNKRSLLVGIF